MKFKIDNDKLEIMEPRIINSGSIAYYLIDCKFDESWNNLVKKAILIKKGENQGTEVAVIDGKIYIDKEYFGNYSIGFVGYQLENEEKVLQISTNLECFYIDKGAGEIVTVETAIPTVTEWEIYVQQLQAIANRISNDKAIVIENTELSQQIKNEMQTMQDEYNQNAEEKTDEFNLNAQNKTDDFDENALNKINAFNSNATEKTTAFNNNASSRTEELNEIAEGIEDMTTAIQFATFEVDDDMHLNIVQAEKLKNTNFIFNPETGRLGVRIHNG